MGTTDPGGAPEPAPEGLADLLAHATFVTMAALTRVAAENDLSLTQLRVLAILRDRRGTMSALAAHLGLDKSTVTGLVDRAQRRGLLARAPNAGDGRATDVFLTPAGRAFAAGVQARTAEALSALTDRLSPADRRRLHTLLARMLGAAEP
jgi:DNA-binding MarR family transcriptional regulator